MTAKLSARIIGPKGMRRKVREVAMQRLETAADSGVLEFQAKHKTERPGSSNSVERHSPTLRSHAPNFSVSFNSTVEEKSGHEFYLRV